MSRGLVVLFVLLICTTESIVVSAGTIPPIPMVQLVYVYQDEPVVPELGSIMAGVDDIFMASSGGARRVRWAAPGSLLFVQDGVQPVHGYARGHGYGEAGRKYILLLGWDTSVCGAGVVIDDDRPGQENKNNTETGYAWLGRQCWNVGDVTHELVHLLGGVQDSAPHASGGHHCTDAHDLLCYSDSPVYPSLTYPCGVTHMLLLDCGGDDYFNVSPVEGSYLSSHWNVADSAYLVRMERVLLPVVGK